MDIPNQWLEDNKEEIVKYSKCFLLGIVTKYFDDEYKNDPSFNTACYLAAASTIYSVYNILNVPEQNDSSLKKLIATLLGVFTYKKLVS